MFWDYIVPLAGIVAVAAIAFCLRRYRRIHFAFISVFFLVVVGSLLIPIFAFFSEEDFSRDQKLERTLFMTLFDPPLGGLHVSLEPSDDTPRSVAEYVLKELQAEKPHPPAHVLNYGLWIFVITCCLMINVCAHLRERGSKLFS